tara:strand:+ start:14673 stop:14810 length:138 start_codon:yes stop_codon:yes gene_type:complete
MRILKELDRQLFKDRFACKEDCHGFLAELKWQTVIVANAVRARYI